MRIREQNRRSRLWASAAGERDGQRKLRAAPARLAWSGGDKTLSGNSDKTPSLRRTSKHHRHLAVGAIPIVNSLANCIFVTQSQHF